MAPPVGLGGFPLRSSWLSAGRSRRPKQFLLRKSPGQNADSITTFADFFFVPFAYGYDSYTAQTYDGSSAYTYHRGPPIASAYVLTVTTRTYSIAGISSILKAGRRLTATTRTYSVSPVTVSLVGGRRITATQQTYSVSGVSSILKAARKLVATQQTYTVTPVSTNLTFSRRLIATTAAYSITGVNSILKADRKLIATQRTYSIAGVSSGYEDWA